MINKIIKIKGLLSLILVTAFCMTTMGAVVSDNDGSAFITKAEFDSLKNNFQSQIDQYNTSIDSKIDGAIASYLAGLSMDSEIDEFEYTSAIYDIGFYTYPNWLLDLVRSDGYVSSVTTAQKKLWTETLPCARSDMLGFDSSSLVNNTGTNFNFPTSAGQSGQNWAVISFMYGGKAFSSNTASIKGLYEWGVIYSTSQSDALLYFQNGSTNTTAGKIMRRITGVETIVGHISHVLCDAMIGITFDTLPIRKIFFPQYLEFYEDVVSVSNFFLGLSKKTSKPCLWGPVFSGSVYLGGSWSWLRDYGSTSGWSESQNAVVRFIGYDAGGATNIKKTTDLFIDNVYYQSTAMDSIKLGAFNGGNCKDVDGGFIYSAMFCTPQNDRYIHAISAGAYSRFFSSVRSNTQSVLYTYGDFILKQVNSITASAVLGTSWSYLNGSSPASLRYATVNWPLISFYTWGFTTIANVPTYKNYILAMNGIEANMTDGVPLYKATYTGTTHIELETDFYAKKIKMLMSCVPGDYNSLSRGSFDVNLVQDNKDEWLSGVRLNLKIGPFGDVVGNGNTLYIATSDGEDTTSYAQDLPANVAGKPGAFDYYINVKAGDVVWLRLDPGEWTWGMDCAKIRSVKMKTVSHE